MLSRRVGFEVVSDDLPRALPQGELDLVPHGRPVPQDHTGAYGGELGPPEHLVELYVAGEACELALPRVCLPLVGQEIPAGATVAQLDPRKRPQRVEVEPVPCELVRDGNVTR